MNQSELDKKLKAAPEPVLDADYRENFSRSVLARLKSRSPAVSHRVSAPAWGWRLAWGGGLAMACLLAGFAVGHWRGRQETPVGGSADVLADSKVISETLAMFPHRVRAIEQDGQGLKLILANQPDIPDSPPLYVRVCDGTQCASLVTFSGQEIEVAGQKMMVLAEASGGIIIMGNNFAWSSQNAASLQKGMQIEAHLLVKKVL